MDQFFSEEWKLLLSMKVSIKNKGFYEEGRFLWRIKVSLKDKGF